MRTLINILTIIVCFPLYGQNNLIDDSTWTAGTGSAPGFYHYGSPSSNLREMDTGPHGTSVLLWKALASNSMDNDGGWDSHYIAGIDHTRTYRLTVWMKKTESTDGLSYFGFKARDANDNYATLKLDGSVKDNPYFISSDLPQINQWYLLVAFVHHSGYSGTAIGGVYDTNGTKVANLKDFKLASGAETIRHRVYLRLTGTPHEQFHWAPTIYEVNGQEPSIQELLNPPGSNVNVTSVSLNPNSLTLSVGESSTISSTVLPNDATDPSLSWSSSNTSVATVNSSGLVTAIAEGSANITATSNSNTTISDSAAVTVSGGGSTGGGIWSENASDIYYDSGKVAVGTNSVPTDYKFAVGGKAIVEELKVQLSANWPDYVFEQEYQLPALSEVKKFIKENGHLPDIPSASEVSKNQGIELGEMNRILLQKIEELTLYIIELEEEFQELSQTINQIKR